MKICWLIKPVRGRSTTPGDYHTWRYSHWLPVDDEVWAYFEAARPNNTNEIRLARFEMACANAGLGWDLR